MVGYTHSRHVIRKVYGMGSPCNPIAIKTVDP
jgi:hypothetical protein